MIVCLDGIHLVIAVRVPDFQRARYTYTMRHRKTQIQFGVIYDVVCYAYKCTGARARARVCVCVCVCV